MTRAKLRKVILLYKRKFKRMGVKPKDFPHGKKLSNRRQGLQHCCAMLDKMLEFIKEGRTEKTMRWLGFIQGFLWVNQTYTLTHVRNHSRPDRRKKRK